LPPSRSELAVANTRQLTEVDHNPLYTVVQTFSSNDDSEPSYYNYSATLRIHGTRLPLEEITRELKTEPSHQHRQGDRRRPGSRPYGSDAWHLTADIPEETELADHLRELWRLVEPNVAYLLSLDAEIDVFCGYRSNNGASGFNLQPDALKIFEALGAPLALSVIVDSWLAQRLDEPSIQ
jgi:hypothetical protein